MELVPVVLRCMHKAFPGIGKKLATIDAREVAYLAVCKASQTYDPAKSKPTTYFSLAIRNAVLKELARGKRWDGSTKKAIPPVLAEKTAGSKTKSQMVLLALSVLPVESRRVIASRYYRQQSVQEIAAATGVSENAVRRRLAAALSQLAALLGDEPDK